MNSNVETVESSDLEVLETLSDNDIVDDSVEVESTVNNGSSRKKRFRTSPRTKAFSEVLGMLNTYNNTKDQVVMALISELRTKILSNVSSVMENNYVPRKYSGMHYVGVGFDGSRVHFKRQVPPTKASSDKDGWCFEIKYSSVLGPFRTEDGAKYAVNHLDHPTKVVW